MDRALQQTLSAGVVQQLRVLTRAGSLSEGFHREAWSQALGPTLELWKRLTQGQDVQRLSAPAVRESADPVVAFVVQERGLAIDILRAVSQDLSELNKLLRGTALLTPGMLALGHALIHGETPGSWQRLWEGPDDPLVWLRAIAARFLALGGLAEHTEAAALLRKPVDLADFLRPDVLLNALRQLSARLLKCPIDSLKFACVWKGGSVPGAKLSATIAGLQLEGCTFDGTRLNEMMQDSPSCVEVPPCTVAWVDKSAPDAYKEGEHLLLPLYFAADRVRVVARMAVPCSNLDKWVQCGAALFLRSK